MIRPEREKFSLPLACCRLSPLPKLFSSSLSLISGFIETPMTEVVPPKVQSSMKRQIPLGRFGRPKEIADVAVFLASHDSSYVTGSVIEVTGGLMM